MSKSRRRKVVTKSRTGGSDPLSANSSKIIKGVDYDGSQSSKDFVVSGHSTGSANTEMEALSHQVSRDAGVVPAYSNDSQVKTEVPEDDRVSYELAGPMLYGPNPSLLKKSPLSKSSSFPRLALWVPVGLAMAAGVGYFTYKFYKNSELRNLELQRKQVDRRSGYAHDDVRLN